MTTDNDELWYVQMDSGELREVTLDELDTAFNAGLIHENTFVMEVNGTEWQTLADVAGLNDEEEPAPTYAPQPAGLARPLPQLSPNGGSQWPQATSAAMSASAWPPVVSATQGYAPRPAPAMPYNLGPQSTAPVVHDLSDLDLNPPFKRRGMGKWVAAVAVLLLGGAGFAATQTKMLPRFAFTAPKLPDGVSAAMTLPRSPEPTPAATTPPAPTPPPVTTAKDPAKEEKAGEEKAGDGKDKTGTPSLSEEMKEKLLSADKSRAKERKSKRTTRAAKASKRSGRGKKSDGGGPFRGGGSSSDPLNSKL